MDRGILTTTYSRPVKTLSEETVLQTLRDFYADEPFVRVVDHLPASKDTTDSNFCDHGPDRPRPGADDQLP